RASSARAGVVIDPSFPELAILQLNLDGTIRHANEVFVSTWGWSASELKDANAVALLRPRGQVVRDIEPENWQAYDEVRRGVRDECRFRTYFNTREGRAVNVVLTAKRQIVRQQTFIQLELEILHEPLGMQIGSQ